MSRLIDADEMRENLLWCKSQSSRYDNYWDDVIERLDVQPTVDAVPVVHGRWEYSENIYDESTWVCSICKEPWTLIDGTPQENGMKYCPNCGAKMDLKEEHNGTDNP